MASVTPKALTQLRKIKAIKSPLYIIFLVYWLFTNGLITGYVFFVFLTAACRLYVALLHGRIKMPSSGVLVLVMDVLRF